MGPFVGFPDTPVCPFNVSSSLDHVLFGGQGFNLLVSVVSLFPHLVQVWDALLLVDRTDDRQLLEGTDG